MLKNWILSVLLLTPTVGAQEEPLIVERALRISVVGTIIDTPRELHLTKDQEARITSLRTHHDSVYSEAVRASYDGVPGQKVTGDLLEIASRVTDEERQHLKELQANYESKLKAVLTPKQYAIAEGLLLRERLRHGGIEAVVRSTDVSLVADLKVSVTVKNIGGLTELRNFKNGIGIEIEEPYHEKVFGLFYQLAPCRGQGGVGPGLSAAFQIANLHGGTLH